MKYVLINSELSLKVGGYIELNNTVKSIKNRKLLPGTILKVTKVGKKVLALSPDGEEVKLKIDQFKVIK